MRRLSLSFLFFFSCLYVFPQGSANTPPYTGVLINGVRWAEYNVDAPGTFTKTPEAWGMLYQWNRKIAYPTEGRLEDNPELWAKWERRRDPLSEKVWEADNNPCPDGWRVPTYEEMESLVNTSCVASIYTQQNGIEGFKIIDQRTQNTIFFPYTNSRSSFGEVTVVSAYYWTRLSDDDCKPYYFDFNYNTSIYSGSMLNYGSSFPDKAFSVRCVFDRCETFSEDTAVVLCPKDLPFRWRDIVLEPGTTSGIYSCLRINPATGCDSVFNLHLIVNLDCDGCPGVLINGVCWAESNVDAPGTFAYAPEAWGMLYQWNRRKAWHARGNIIKDDWKYEYSDLEKDFWYWKAENDPCPDGWRVPTYEEMETLLETSKVTYTYTEQKGVNGLKIMDRQTQNTIFLPHTFAREDDGYFHPYVWDVYYWNNIAHRITGYMLSYRVNNDRLSLSFSHVNSGFPVRCVYPFESVVQDTSVIICDAELPYRFRDTIFEEGTTSGIYTFPHTPTGCDSILNLHLTIHHPNVSFSDAVCPGSEYKGNGFHIPTVHRDTVVHDTLKSVLVSGCDSIRTLVLTMYPTYHDIPDYAEICEGEPFQSHGIYPPGEHTISIQHETMHGCDSLVTLHLTVHPLQETTILDTACQGDDYSNHGFSLADVQPGLIPPAPLSLPSIHGCDSTVYLYLTVHPKQETLLHDFVCPGEPYKENGFNIPSVTRSEKHYLRLKTIHGCDSTIALNLYLNDTYLFPTDTAICEGNTVFFQDKPYDKAGIYYDSLTTVHGCDSIYLLHLTVHPVYPDVQVSGVLCEGETFTQYGFNVTEPGEHTLHLTTLHGCDSIVTLTLTEEKKVQGEITSLLEDCTTHSYSFLFAPSLPVSTWLWEMGDGKTYTQEEAFHSYADSGTYQVQLHTTTPNDCGNLFSYTQRVPPYLPKVHISADRTLIDEDYPTVKFSAEVLPGMTCLWDFGDGTKEEGNEANGANEVEHTYDITEARIYEVTLQVLNEDECLTEATLDIEAVVFPKDINTFTPNADGINDTFMTGFRIEVFNRSGLRIYAGDNGWDGSYKGKQAVEDTYFYKLTFRTAYGERTKTGYVVLVR